MAPRPKKNTARRHRQETLVPVPMREFGNTGTDLVSGILNEDFNSALMFPYGIEIFDKMRKSDAQVQASLKAIKTPLLTANWVIDGNKSISPEIKEFIEHALFEDMEIHSMNFARGTRLS